MHLYSLFFCSTTACQPPIQCATDRKALQLDGIVYLCGAREPKGKCLMIPDSRYASVFFSRIEATPSQVQYLSSPLSWTGGGITSRGSCSSNKHTFPEFPCKCFFSCCGSGDAATATSSWEKLCTLTPLACIGWMMTVWEGEEEVIQLKIARHFGYSAPLLHTPPPLGAYPHTLCGSHSEQTATKWGESSGSSWSSSFYTLYSPFT